MISKIVKIFKGNIISIIKKLKKRNMKKIAKLISHLHSKFNLIRNLRLVIFHKTIKTIIPY